MQSENQRLNSILSSRQGESSIEIEKFRVRVAEAEEQTSLLQVEIQKRNHEKFEYENQIIELRNKIGWYEGELNRLTSLQNSRYRSSYHFYRTQSESS